ncbi:hypothetical protein SLE2022_292220 [Rubroshorea leprosula]
MLLEIKTIVTEKALAAFSWVEMMRFEAILYRHYRDQSLILEVLHPQYLYMRVLKAHLYGLLASLMAVLRCVMASYATGIKLKIAGLKQVLGLNKPMSEAQLTTCANLMQFLQWLLPFS